MMKCLVIVALCLAGASAFRPHGDFGKFNLKGLSAFIKKTENMLGIGEQEEESSAEEEFTGVCITGKAQSPIDFKRNETSIMTADPLHFSGIFQTPRITNITHAGDTIRVLIDTEKPITVSGGVFGEKVYKFQQLHFHWGRSSREGSEHTVESTRFPLECHLVFYKADSATPETDADGMAVIGVHYEPTWVNNKVLAPIVSTIHSIGEVNQYVAQVGGFPLRKYLPNNIDTYFSYTGSLTTPPCTEGVTWVWFTDVAKVSTHQVSSFKSIHDGSGHVVKKNFRGTQPLNGRSVYLVNPY